MATQGTLGTLSVDIDANMRGFSRSMSQVQSRMNKVSTKMKSIGKSMTAAVTLPILGLGAASIKLASDFEESLNKIDVAFKDNADEVKKWSKTTLKSFGVAQGTALDMAALFGDMGTAMGFTTGEAADMSKTLVGLAGDLASFKNIRIEEAETALKSIYTGETESLKNLGIVMTQANLERFAMNQGIEKSIKDMTEAEKVNLRYNFVLAKTTNAQGDFANTSSGAANQMRIFTEGLKQLGQQLGAVLLPIATQIITKLNSMVDRFSALGESQKKTIVIVAGVIAVLGPLLLLVGTLIPAITALAGVIAGISTPVLIVIGVIAGLIAILTTLWNTNENFRNAVIKIWNEIKESAIRIWVRALKPALTKTFEAIKETAIVVFDALKRFWDRWGSSILTILKSYWEQFKTTIETVIKIISNIITAVLALIRGDWEAFGESIGNIVNAIVTYIKDTFSNFAPAFKSIWEGFKNIVFDIWDSIKQKISSIIDSIISKINAVMSKITAVKNAASTVSSNVVSGAKSFGQSVSSGASRIVSSIPRFETGTNFVPNDGLAYLHKGEAVVPQKYNNSKMGGLTINVTGNTISGQREADKMASTIVSRLRMAGVNP